MLQKGQVLAGGDNIFRAMRMNRAAFRSLANSTVAVQVPRSVATCSSFHIGEGVEQSIEEQTCCHVRHALGCDNDAGRLHVMEAIFNLCMS